MEAGTLAAIAETVTALGAFAARIVFRDLPRALAAPTMSTIFGSFDGVIVVAMALLTAAAVARWAALGLRGRADRIVLAATASLILLGMLDVGYVHPHIREMFEAGRTLEPQFQSLHKLSTRSANLEVFV